MGWSSAVLQETGASKEAGLAVTRRYLDPSRRSRTLLAFEGSSLGVSPGTRFWAIPDLKGGFASLKKEIWTFANTNASYQAPVFCFGQVAPARERGAHG